MQHVPGRSREFTDVYKRQESSWVYSANKGMYGEKEIKITVRSLRQLTVTSITKPEQYTWQVVYRLDDQLGTALPAEVCSSLHATESFERNIWPTLSPTMGHPVLSGNRLTDTLNCSPIDIPLGRDGDGRQIITIDHMRRTHDVRIPLSGNMVYYENITYHFGE